MFDAAYPKHFADIAVLSWRSAVAPAQLHLAGGEYIHCAESFRASTKPHTPLNSHHSHRHPARLPQSYNVELLRRAIRPPRAHHAKSRTYAILLYKRSPTDLWWRLSPLVSGQKAVYSYNCLTIAITTARTILDRPPIRPRSRPSMATQLCVRVRATGRPVRRSRTMMLWLALTDFAIL